MSVEFVREKPAGPACTFGCVRQPVRRSATKTHDRLHPARHTHYASSRRAERLSACPFRNRHWEIAMLYVMAFAFIALFVFCSAGELAAIGISPRDRRNHGGKTWSDR